MVQADPVPSEGAADREVLDELAMLLIQLEPADREGLTRLRDGLYEFVLSGSLKPAAQMPIAGAARKIDNLLKEGSSGLEEALSEAGRLLEEAMNLLGGATAQPSPPAPLAAATPNEESSLHESESAPAESVPVEDSFFAADLSMLPDFLTESREYVEGAEAALLTLEGDPEEAESINVVFRAFHTVKGTAAFLGLDPISGFAHHAESLFDRFREGELRCAGSLADLSFRSVDMLKALLDSAEPMLAGEPLRLPAGYSELMELLGDPAAVGKLNAGDARLGDILVAEGKAKRGAVEAAAATQGENPIGVALVRDKAASLTDVGQALRKQKASQGGTESVADASVRVRTDRLDQLVDMIGELVIAQSMIAQDALVTQAGDTFVRKVTHADKIVRELQDLSVSLRMVPLKTTFQKMARLVRDTARKANKEVELITEGEDTEIDRTMVDIIGDPLVHMIRNAVDHGIEPPKARQATDKPRQGTVRLSAYHAGGNVVVELQDDGKGLDRERILKKAIEKGVIAADAVLSDHETLNLIFAPGFSTAEQVTDLSGRGVGMDVVKRNVESVRGRIDVSSEPGRGSIFQIRLPLTLAVTDGMLIQVADERYILPTVNIQLSFRPETSSLSTVAGRGELVMLRGELLPIVRLHRLFDVPDAVIDPTRALLVVVGFGEQRCALLVDELLGQQQVVAKSLGEGLGKVEGVSGGAILGDGRVGLILDIAELIGLARRNPGRAVGAVAA